MQKNLTPMLLSEWLKKTEIKLKLTAHPEELGVPAVYVIEVQSSNHLPIFETHRLGSYYKECDTDQKIEVSLGPKVIIQGQTPQQAFANLCRKLTNDRFVKISKSTAPLKTEILSFRDSRVVCDVSMEWCYEQFGMEMPAPEEKKDEILVTPVSIARRRGLST